MACQTDQQAHNDTHYSHFKIPFVLRVKKEPPIARRLFEFGLVIDISSMTNFHHHDNDFVIMDFCNDSIISYTITPLT